jgi:hypothetical protein
MLLFELTTAFLFAMVQTKKLDSMVLPSTYN